MELVLKLYRLSVMKELTELLLIMVVLDIQLQVLVFKRLFLALVRFSYQKLNLGRLIMLKDMKIYSMKMMVSYQEVITTKVLNLHHSMHQEVLEKYLNKRTVMEQLTILQMT